VRGVARRGRAGLGLARLGELSHGKVCLSFGIVPSFNAW
jgi:hypothetical protein